MNPVRTNQVGETMGKNGKITRRPKGSNGMKRLIANLIVSLGLVFVQLGSVTAAPARYWKVDIFDPAASTVNRTLNVEYKVFSTLETDNDYDVKLLQNESQVGATQQINHVYGDSGVFSVSIPATGSYKYQVVATNNDAGETLFSAEKTVQVVNGPTPTVTTVFTNTGAAGGGAGGVQGQGAGGAGAGGAGGGVAAADGGGQTAGAATDEDGQVTDEAAKDTKDVLGAESTADDKKDSSSRKWLYGGGLLAAVVAGAVAYYLLVMRKADS